MRTEVTQQVQDGQHRLPRDGERAVRCPYVASAIVQLCVHPIVSGRNPSHVACWNAHAPISVGDSDAVKRAGALRLRTSETHVVVREAPQGGRWLAATGLGRQLRDLPGSYVTQEDAITAAVAAAVVNREARVEEIRAARGGTLDWGRVVHLDDDLFVRLPAVGQRAGAAAALQLRLAWAEALARKISGEQTRACGSTARVRRHARRLLARETAGRTVS